MVAKGATASSPFCQIWRGFGHLPPSGLPPMLPPIRKTGARKTQKCRWLAHVEITVLVLRAAAPRVGGLKAPPDHANYMGVRMADDDSIENEGAAPLRTVQGAHPASTRGTRSDSIE